MTFEDIFRALEKNRVRYVVVGGVAVVLHGYVRFTKDIDLVLDFSSDNVARFVQAASELGFRPGVPINPEDLARADKRAEWTKEKNAQAITFNHPESPLLQIDVLLGASFEDIKTTRKKIGDLRMTVIAYKDLVKMTRESGRPIDLADIEKLEDLRKI